MMRRKTTPAAQAQSLSTRSAKQAVEATASLARMHRILSRSLRASAKELVLSWTEGQPMAREADVVLLQQGKTLEARVDLAARMLISLQERKDVQAPFLASEIFGADEAIKKDPRVVEALKKRGLTDLNTVRCTALPLAYAAIPEQDTQRIGFGGCSQQHGFYHGWDRSIDGLTLQMDMVTKKVLKVMSRVGFDYATARW